MEVRREASSLAGLDPPATLIFDYPTIDSIAGYIVNQLAEPAAAAPATSFGSLAQPARRRPRRRPAVVERGPAPPLSAAHKSALVASKVQDCVSKVLGGAEVAASTPLMTAGLDSLGAVELRTELGR